MLTPIKRIWHPWDKWECYKAGFWNTTPPQGLSMAEGEQLYCDFFREKDFAATLTKVLKEWPHSCEHNLTSASLNKIAWGGQAAACYALGLPADCRAGYNLLDANLKKEMDNISESLIRGWYKERGYEPFKNLRTNKNRS